MLLLFLDFDFVYRSYHLMNFYLYFCLHSFHQRLAQNHHLSYFGLNLEVVYLDLQMALLQWFALHFLQLQIYLSYFCNYNVHHHYYRNYHCKYLLPFQIYFKIHHLTQNHKNLNLLLSIYCYLYLKYLLLSISFIFFSLIKLFQQSLILCFLHDNFGYYRNWLCRIYFIVPYLFIITFNMLNIFMEVQINCLNLSFQLDLVFIPFEERMKIVFPLILVLYQVLHVMVLND